jgi:hypothetical protein
MVTELPKILNTPEYPSNSVTMGRLKGRDDPLKAIKIYEDDWKYINLRYLKNSLEAGRDMNCYRFGILADEFHDILQKFKEEEAKKEEKQA